MDLYVEFGSISDISSFMARMKVQGISIVELEMTKVNSTSDAEVAAIMTIKSEEAKEHADVMGLISQMPGVKFVEGL